MSDSLNTSVDEVEETDTADEAETVDVNETADQQETAIFERWSQLQIHFVQDPHAAVAEADALIDEIVQERRRTFDARRALIDDRWQGPGTSADTEDLRVILQDYRKVLSDLFPRQS